MGEEKKKESNLSVVLYGPRDIRIEDTEHPGSPRAGEVLCETDYVGICGTDVNLWQNAKIGNFIIKDPFILGHEVSATVVEVGQGVKDLKKGDRVAIENAVPCGRCDVCRRGKYNLCEIANIRSVGLPPTHGCLRKFFIHSADYCFKLPDNVSSEEGAIVEPLAVLVHACNRGDLRIGSYVLVCGSGTIGILAGLTCYAYGATKVLITDIKKEKLDAAKMLGLDLTLQINPKDTHEELVERITEKLGKMPEVTFECSGAEASIQLACLATATGGKVVVVGLGREMVKIPLTKTSFREVDLIGVLRFRHAYPMAIELLKTGRIDVKQMITHKFHIKETLKAFEAQKDGVGVKILIGVKDVSGGGGQVKGNN